jgi:hypothetical protein
MKYLAFYKRKYTRWGVKGMLNTEAAFAILAVILFLLLQTLMKEKSGRLKFSQLPVQNLTFKGNYN